MHCKCIHLTGCDKNIKFTFHVYKVKHSLYVSVQCTLYKVNVHNKPNLVFVNERLTCKRK